MVTLWIAEGGDARERLLHSRARWLLEALAGPGAMQEEGRGEGNHAQHSRHGFLMMASHRHTVIQPAATPCKKRK